MNDCTDFETLLIALKHLGFDDHYQSQIFKLLAAILHLGNIEIESQYGEESSSVIDTKSLDYTSNLLGVSNKLLSHWLCNKKIKTVHEVLIKPLTLSQVKWFICILIITFLGSFKQR